jgi:hypothetical protein
MNITGNYFTTVKYGIVCGANITTTRITNNDFSGFTGSVNAIWCKALTVGIRIVCNRIEGFDCGFLDEGVGNDFSHNYLENNTLTQDRTAADLPISIGNTIVSGGAGTFPTDRTTARIQIQPRTFIVDDTAAEFGGGYKEYYRSIRAGDQNAYSVTATGSGTLTYTTITTLLLNYSVFGNTMTVQWFLTGTIGGAGAELRIALPSGVTAVGRRRNLVHNHEAGAYKVGVAEVQNGDAFIRISKDVNISGNWTAGTADTSGSIHFQCSGI